jgi:16S rRNA (cytosine967-C5)-methyltransferase
VHSIQRIAAQSIAAVLGGRSLTPTLETAWQRNRQLTAAERGAIQDISFGTLRHLGRLQAFCAPAIRRAQPGYTRCCLRRSISSNSPGSSVCHRGPCRRCRIYHSPRTKSFANACCFQRRHGLLGFADSTDEGRYSYPSWWIAVLRTAFPDDVNTQQTAIGIPDDVASTGAHRAVNTAFAPAVRSRRRFG